MYQVSSKVVFGTGAAAQTGKIAHSLGASSVLLVHDKGIKQTGMVDTIIGYLKSEGLKVHTYDQVAANPTDALVAAGAAMAAEMAVDLIIGLGGGSALDAAKAINILLTNAGPIQNYEGINLVSKPTLPLLAIPTTAGTASEVTAFAIITDTARSKKMVIAGKQVCAEIALVDPNLTLSLPPVITAHTGLDALTHAVEAYLSVLASPFTDVNALKAIELIYHNLAVCVLSGQDSRAREQVALGSVLAGFAFNSAILGLAHGIAHPLGAHFGVPHGLANAIVLPAVMQFNSQVVPQKILDIGRIIGLTGEELTVDGVTGKFKELNQVVGIPPLRETGIGKDQFAVIARDALEEGSLLTNPRKVEYEDVMAILEKVY